MGNNLKRAVISVTFGLILSFALNYLWILLVCITVAPLFILIKENTKKKSLGIGFFYGFGTGLGSFFWMIRGISHYTGNDFFYGVLVFLISSIFLGIYFAAISWITKTILTSNIISHRLLVLNRLCVAAVWATFEFVFAFTLQSFPLHSIRIGFPFVTNIYTIQLSSYGGLILLSFLTVLINLFVAEFYIQKKKLYLLYGFSILAFMFIIGAVTFYTFKPSPVGKSFKIAVVSDNTNPETKWNSENGNTFANNYFKLCKDAVALEPDFIIWPETALPWTYSPDDDLLKEIIKISSNHDLTHVIGINNENSTDKKLYNSVFYINNQNRVNGIYNKQILLKGIEEPVGKFLVPFLSQDGFVLSKGHSQQPIQTRFGKAGNLICNEVVVENCGAEQVRNGANFLFNFSNDGWFKDNYISDLHFYYTRLQAVENRKDISVANNCGINAIINSNGSIISEKKGTSGTLVSGTIQPNNNISLFTKYPLFFPVLFIMFILIYLLTIKLKSTRNRQIPRI
ncbi:apolipoprotein N-acyltransferase [Flavobacterium piscis]|uniref:Apolipoprotein N-acyltransferase n=1 Tax=Flavobacterium piscis TaxID=1114874 RepID=A0ABU1YDH3_9FLAO|nr:apolipoprotein N-acyltransferase [Flavobacterium piscis]MDR7212294.1 apolipoprotein N-acyltransferase [Flavobacterium piscis]